MLDFILSEKIIKTISVIVITTIIYIVINRIIKKLLKVKTGIKTFDSKKHKTFLSITNNLIKAILIIIAIITIMGIFEINTSGILASLGVVSAVAALAAQDILKDILAGILILVENQYDVGDTVTINGFKGEVVGIGLRTTKLKSITGEYCFISNRNIGDVINHSLSKSLAIVNVEVSYNEKIEKVEKVLNGLSERLSKEIKDLKGPIIIDGIDDLGDSGIVFRLSVETNPLKNYEIQRKLRREIKLEFDKNNIEIPYKQLVIHNE